MRINLYADVIYDKDNIIISKLDLDYYKQIHFKKYNEYINDSKALKNLVIIEKLIIKLKKNNPSFLNKIDTNIYDEIGEENIKSQTILNVNRYFKTKNEFIYDFFNKKFNVEDLEIIFNSFESLELPISQNNCLTIVKLIDFKNNTEFINIFFKNMKNQINGYKIIIDNINYDVCINQRNENILEKAILKYIDLKIQDDFNKFIYE